VVSSQARREQVAIACERGLSQRRACELLEMARSALSYRPVRAERDAPALEAMRRLAAQYPRYGYRRIRIFLTREGLHMSRHRAHSSLDYLTPIEFKQHHQFINQGAVLK
jgi:putative transposase